MTGGKVPFSDGPPWHPWLPPSGRHGKPLHWPGVRHPSGWWEDNGLRSILAGSKEP